MCTDAPEPYPSTSVVQDRVPPANVVVNVNSLDAFGTFAPPCPFSIVVFAIALLCHRTTFRFTVAEFPAHNVAVVGAGTALFRSSFISMFQAAQTPLTMAVHNVLCFSVTSAESKSKECRRGNGL